MKTTRCLLVLAAALVLSACATQSNEPLAARRDFTTVCRGTVNPCGPLAPSDVARLFDAPPPPPTSRR